MIRLKIARFLPFFIIIIFSVLLLVNKITDRGKAVYISLNTTTDSINTVDIRILQRFGNIEVHAVENKEISINNPPFLIKAFAPDKIYFLDGLRLLFIAIVGIILCFTFWDFTYRRPFTKQTTLGILLITICLFVMISIEIMRNAWLVDYLKDKTGQSFEMDTTNFFFSPEVWLSAIFLRITKIFKKGTKLQHEQDLTV